MTKFRVKVLLEDGSNHTETVEADNPNAASMRATDTLRKRGIVTGKILTVKKWKGESSYEAPKTDDVGRLFGGNVRSIVHTNKQYRAGQD